MSMIGSLRGVLSILAFIACIHGAWGQDVSSGTSVGTAPDSAPVGRWQIVPVQPTFHSGSNALLVNTSTGETWELSCIPPDPKSPGVCADQWSPIVVSPAPSENVAPGSALPSQ